MTGLFEKAGLWGLHRMDPERAHGLASIALLAGFAPRGGPITSPRLKTRLAGMDLPNPLGLAAGFDKNATLLTPLSKCGFGFLEAGGATPRPQTGNARPRLFRLSRDRAVINRFGFNNPGAEVIARRLQDRPRSLPVGINIGANKDSSDRAADYVSVLTQCGPNADFATINVSSPNTEKLRDLQGKAALMALLDQVMDARAALARPIPVFLKIAPDLTRTDLDDIAGAAHAAGIDAIIATNTTLARDGLKSRHAGESGGLSGAPLFEPSTRVLAYLSEATGGAVPLIGVGGIEDADTAYAKIRAGASALQLYTALVYRGLGLIGDITSGLEARLARDGFANVAEAVGTARKDWL
ncbi:MAG: quinone-dependent dihydroorotate dehydrogenase [Marinibacterium sp.]